MTLKPVDIIIPTFNNWQYVESCVRSMLVGRPAYPLNIILVNNGAVGSCDQLRGPNVTIIEPGKNLGWEGGINAGLAVSTSEFVVTSNDDVFVPLSSYRWLRMLLELFANPDVASVGPTSNVVMGAQQIFHCPTVYAQPTKFLIGFCVMHRRSALEKIKESTGYNDETCPGGDDLDLGIRYRKAGYSLMCHRGVFIYHHGFKTGIRVHGDQTQGGWNSAQMTDQTNNWLIRKHGFKEFVDLWRPVEQAASSDVDHEGNLLRDWVSRIPHEVIVEVGCGGNKTIPESIGVDRIPKGEQIPFVNQKSAADVVCDANGKLPFVDEYADVVIARHVIEHVLDTVAFLQELRRVLKPGGQVLIATPNQDMCDSIPLNSEHVHTWNPNALQKILQCSGFRIVERVGFEQGIAMLFRCEKPLPVSLETSGTTSTGTPTMVLN